MLAHRPLPRPGHDESAEYLLLHAGWASHLAREELERAIKGLSRRRLAKGCYLFHSGDSFDYWAGVRSGLLKIRAVSPEGKPITFMGVRLGGWFGEGSLLKNERRKYDVAAIRDTELALLQKGTFLWLYENSLGFNHFLVQQMNHRIAYLVEAMECQRFLPATARMARCICRILGSSLPWGAKKRIEISQEELGLLAGLSRQNTNESLQELANKGLISWERGALVAADVSKLARYG